MKIQVGDLFKAKEDVLVHGCNCFNVMGAGIALQVVKMYPGAYYEADMYTIRGDKAKLGTYSAWTGNHFFYDQRITIVNAYTQYYANPNTKPLDYEALGMVMRSINNQFPTESIAMPKIGAGLAGGNWDRILIILNSVFLNRDNVTVYIYEK